MIEAVLTGESGADKKMTKQVVVRMDDALYIALSRDAVASGRTVAQSVRFHLRASLSGSRDGSDG